MTKHHVHGGPDAGPAITWDFSSNANAWALPTFLYEVLLKADRRVYPDPHYTELRVRMASTQGVASERILPTAGSSEAIRRLTLAAHLRGITQVWVPRPGYGDYEAAAHALGMMIVGYDDPRQALEALNAHRAGGPALLWLCEPCNPTGRTLPSAFWSALSSQLSRNPQTTVAMDRAYEPMRLTGTDPVPHALADACWQLWSPNKALGLTGVRAGWMRSPDHAQDEAHAMHKLVQRLAPSWVLSAEGVSLLMHWHDDSTQAWLADARVVLSTWMQAQRQTLSARGWACQPSVTPFCLAQPPAHHRADGLDLLTFLRQQGIKLRDADSFGLTGLVRLRAHQPAAQAALLAALDAWGPGTRFDQQPALTRTPR